MAAAPVRHRAGGLGRGARRASDRCGLAERLRLSNAMRDRLAGLARLGRSIRRPISKEQRRALYRLGAERYRDLALLRPPKGGSTGKLWPNCWPAPPRGRRRVSRSPGAT